MVNLSLRMNVEEEVWKKRICERIREAGREAWKDGFKNTERKKEYVKKRKECHRRERFSDGSVGVNPLATVAAR